LSKLFDRLKGAARAHREATVKPGGLLWQALERAHAERAQARAASGHMQADIEIVTAEPAFESEELGAAILAEEGAEAEEGAHEAEARARLRRRVIRGAILVLGVAIATLAWNYLPLRKAPAPVLQLDRTLHM